MNSERGNREWLNDYMSLKQVNPNNPFTVPEGYFDELEQQIVSFIKLDELKTASPSNGFIVPEGYFNELSDNIRSRIVIEENLDKETTGFIVPEGYFDELSKQIQSQITVDEALKNAEDTFTVPKGYFDELSKQIQSRIMVGEALEGSAEAMTVPEGYFDHLSDQIQSRIMVEEALNESAQPLSVPDNYFDKLTENILSKTTGLQIETKEVVKQRGVVRQLFSSATFSYATAACLTLAVGATIFFSKNSSNVVKDHNSSFLHKSLSSISVDDIKSYLQLNVDPNDTRTIIDESKQVNADNLSDDLQDELDTSQ